MLSQLILLNFAGASLHHREDLVCNDQEIRDQCLAKCRLDYLDCRANCDSQFCNSACLAEFQECEGSCPCGLDCPAGCSDCPQHPLCATTTTEVSTVTTTTTELPTDPNEVFILVIPQYIEGSYLMSGDGSSQITANIDAPSNYYAEYARHALVNGKLFIFGGTTDGKRIARLDDCTLNELPVRLHEGRTDNHAALSINNGSEALICFGLSSTSCESFDGISSILSTFSADWTHASGGLALYRSQPTSVGCVAEFHNKVETLTYSGWAALQDFPTTFIYYHTLVGLDNKSMLLFGGNYFDIRDYQTGIWQLQSDQWSRIGELSQPAEYGSALYIGRSIYFFAGDPSRYPIQKIDMNDNEEIQKVEVIGNQPYGYDFPVLFQTNSDYCV